MLVTGKRSSVRREPAIWEWTGTREPYLKAKAAGFPEELMPDGEGKVSGKGQRLGTRKAIKDFTRVSRDRRLKFTLRNALCDWLSFCTLTYPADYPQDGRVCKRHFNLLLTHLGKDYPGIKYVWFMEFQDKNLTRTF